MSENKGDPSKQPPECKSVFTPFSESFPRPCPSAPGDGVWSRCPNIKAGYSDWELERYGCEVCGRSYTLYYDEMR